MHHPYPAGTKIKTKPSNKRGRVSTIKLIGTVSDHSQTRDGYRYNIMIEPDEWNRHHEGKTNQIETLRFYNDEIEPTGEGTTLL